MELAWILSSTLLLSGNIFRPVIRALYQKMLLRTANRQLCFWQFAKQRSENSFTFINPVWPCLCFGVRTEEGFISFGS
jgi:hypothetical protein